MPDLISLWQQNFQRPAMEVYIDGARALPLSVNITNGLDAANAVANIIFADYPQRTGLRAKVEIRLGYGPYLITAFIGETETTTRQIAPHQYQISCAGKMKFSRYRYGGEDLPFLDATDTYMVDTVLEVMGLTQRSIEGRDIMLATLQPIWLSPETTPWDIVSRLDQDWGYRTFDTPDGTIRRRRVSGYPSEDAVFTFTEGEMGFSFIRPRSVLYLHNRVHVTGLPQGAFLPQGIREDDSEWIPNPPRYITLDHRSDYIETIEQCEEVAERLMYEHNHIAEEMTIEVPGNPYIVPQMTVAVISPNTGISDAVNYLVQQIVHDFSSSGFTTRLELRGGVGAPGEWVDPYPGGGDPVPPLEPNPDPEPAISYILTREGFLPEGAEVANVPVDSPDRVRYYTFSGDALGSYDPAGLPEDLTFAWENNKNSDTSTDRFYATAFTKDEMETDADCTVSLTVTSVNGSRTLEIPLTAEEAIIRIISAVFGERAIASGDGGETWQEFSIPATNEEGGTVEGEPEEQTLSTVYRSPPGGGQIQYFIFIVDPDNPTQRWDSLPFPGAGKEMTRVYDHNTGEWEVELISMHDSLGNPSTVGPTIRVAIEDGSGNVIKDSVLGGLTNVGDSLVLQDVGVGVPAGTPFTFWYSVVDSNHNITWSYVLKVTGPASISTAVSATPEIGSTDFLLYGTNDGAIWRIGILEVDGERVFNAPTLVANLEEVFSQVVDGDNSVTAMWLNEADHNRLTVGTHGGRIFRGPTDADSTDFWEKINTESLDAATAADGYIVAPPIVHLIESALNPGEYRISTGERVYITHNDFQGVIDGYPFDTISGTAEQATLSPFGNYGAKANTDPGGEVVDENGTEITLPALSAGERTITTVTHHIREGGLWAITSRGHVLYKEPDATSFTQLTTIPDSTALHTDDLVSVEDHYHGINFAVRDGAAFLTVYAAGIMALHKTYDGGLTWRKLFTDEPPGGGIYDSGTRTFDTGSDPAVDAEAAILEWEATHIGYGSPPWIT